jgi:hypothetical protein
MQGNQSQSQSQLSSPPSSSPTPSSSSLKVLGMLSTEVKDMVYEVHELIRTDPSIITYAIVNQLKQMIKNDIFVNECTQMLTYCKVEF